MLVAGGRAKRIFWVTCLGGGVLSGIAAIYARHSLGWNHMEALSLIAVGGVIGGIAASVLGWKFSDYRQKVQS